jgi:two-component system cell cycle response regulator
VGVIGQLEIVENPRAFYRELVYTVGVALIGYGALTLLICALIAYLLKRQLERPLRRVAQFAAELTPDRLTVPLALERVRRGTVATKSISSSKVSPSSSSGINSHIANLDQQVAQRTIRTRVGVGVDPPPVHAGPADRLLQPPPVQRADPAGARSGHALPARPVRRSSATSTISSRINDTCGHLVGDQVLQEAAECFRRELRAHVDWVARYGGEEFVIVLPETALPSAVAMAERLRLALTASLAKSAPGDDRSPPASASPSTCPVKRPRACSSGPTACSTKPRPAGRNRTLPAL